MPALRVATWNAEGMFVAGTKTRRAGPHDAVTVLRQLEADIVVIPEFGRLSDLTPETEAAIRRLGYELITLAYDEPRSPGLGFAIASRLPVQRTYVHSLSGSARQALEIVCVDSQGKELHVIGVHLDDRSEAGRMNEMRSLAEVIDRLLRERVIVMGDFNAMHRDAWFAKLARSRAGRIATVSVLHTLTRSMAERVREMAIGSTIEYLLQKTHLHDTDTGRQRTISAKQAGLEWAPAVRLAKIDWIFASSQFHTKHYRVLRDVGSDHRPVVATLEYE